MNRKLESTLSLLEDLEEIQNSLRKIVDHNSQIPTLDDVVENHSSTTLNPDNPFLSGDSLCELIKIRNQAEAHAAKEIASLKPTRSIDEILGHSKSTDQPISNQLTDQLEVLFRSWSAQLARDYAKAFEQNLKSHLEHNFTSFINTWLDKYDPKETPPQWTKRNGTDR